LRRGKKTPPTRKECEIIMTDYRKFLRPEENPGEEKILAYGNADW